MKSCISQHHYILTHYYDHQFTSHSFSFRDNLKPCKYFFSSMSFRMYSYKRGSAKS